uniref:Serine/threonine-protein kinase ULK4-like n=1 Tax=Castor canadensis TaxID=51338 RepID=A0A8B7TQM1_CASCN
LVSHVCNLFTETATLCLDRSNKNNKEMAATLLFSLLDILHGMLTYTSSVVRLALQAQKSGSGGDTQAAEDLLLLSKPLTGLISLLLPLLPSEDPEIFDVSSKCLSILVQLYGGENPDSLSLENLESFADLLVSKADPKEQRLLLRILRRMRASCALLGLIAWPPRAGASGVVSSVALGHPGDGLCHLLSPLPLQRLENVQDTAAENYTEDCIMAQKPSRNRAAQQGSALSVPGSPNL